MFFLLISIVSIVEVSPLNSSIRFLLLRAEEKYQRAEQSDDSLEENYHQQTVDSLSDDENDEFFFRSTTLKEDEWVMNVMMMKSEEKIDDFFSCYSLKNFYRRRTGHDFRNLWWKMRWFTISKWENFNFKAIVTSFFHSVSVSLSFIFFCQWKRTGNLTLSSLLTEKKRLVKVHWISLI